MSAETIDVPHRGLLTLCVMAATIMQALDSTIANVALPYMQGSLSATQDQITWVLTSYIVSAAIMMPVSGYFTARFGRKKLLMTAVAGFTLASGLCGAAQTLNQMVLFRLLQGVFGAPLVPMSQAILLDSYPREKHGSAMAMWGVGVMVGPILGPMLGGYLTEYYNWRWVFYINVPIGVAVVFGLIAVLTESKTQQMRFDWMGFLTLSISVGALQMMLDRGQLVDWFSSNEIIIEATLAALAFYLFIVHSATAENPFIDPRLFADNNFRVGVALIFVVGVILLASVALLTPYLQELMNYPVLTAGLVLGPRGVGTMASMMIVGRIINRTDPRLFLLVGLACTAYSLREMTTFTPDVAMSVLLVNGIIQGAGLGFLFTPLSTVTFASLPSHLRTQGTSIFSLLRNLGSSIGVSVVMFMLERNIQVMHANLAPYANALNHGLHTPAARIYWNLGTLSGRAMLNAEITRQATIVAYIDDYRLMAILALAAMPLVIFLRRAQAQPGEIAMAME
ncbi:MAG: DHA2 family efflux MFS transporter permease subunit [Hyphomicrobiales bacterium]|nr:DHA2 family efflux MFS transporter permease subunit [Hyphomicrobiales bacterium]